MNIKIRRYAFMSNHKRYRVRYDRIVVVILVIAVIAVIASSLIIAVTRSDVPTAENTSTETSTAETTAPSIVDNLETTAPPPTEFQTTAPPATSPASETLTAETSQPATQSVFGDGFVGEMHAVEDVYKGDLVLVNTNHAYTFPLGDMELVTLFDHILIDYYSVSDYVIKLDLNVVEHLNQMMTDFYNAEQNTDITVIGGYRTYEEQADKYANGISALSGGYSDYHTARTFDLGIFPKDGSSSGYYSPTGSYSWVDENASNYGFIVRYPDGKDNVTGETARPQTYRYVGTPHSTYIKKNNLCLEEYIDRVKSYTKDSPLEISVGTSLYHVYFVQADPTGNPTAVPVPTDKEYSVSGDNCEGFIVTVKFS